MTRSPIRRAIAGVLVPLLLALAAAPAGAVARSWVSAVNGSADDPSRWSPAAVPGAADNLLFPLGGAYSVLFPSATVPQVISHDYRAGGVVTLSTDGTHTCSNSFGIGQTSSAGVNVVAGTFRAKLLSVGTVAGIYGRLTLTLPGGLPVPPSPVFQQTDSSSTSTYGSDGIARVEILGGSTHSLEGVLTMANTATSICTLTVAGFNSSTLTASTFVTNNPRRNATLGATGQFVGNVDNGGALHIAGPTWIGQHAGSVAILRVGASTTTFSPGARFDGLLRIGDTGFLGSQGGTAEVQLYRGTLGVGGFCTLGDPDGTPGSVAALRIFGGTASIEAGMTRYSPTAYVHTGGTLRFLSGPVSWGGTFTESGPDAGPFLYLRNGAADTVRDFVAIGRSGAGRLRVSQPGTQLQIGDYLAVADSLGGTGTVELDSSALVRSSTPMFLGRGGAATVSVRGGASLAATEIDCAESPGSTSAVSVTGAGSTLAFDELFVGGAITPGGIATLLVDSSATATGRVVDVHPGSTLDVRSGARVQLESFDCSGDLRLDGGTLRQTPLANLFVNAGGSLHGCGTAVGWLQVAGPIDTRRAAATYGRLDVQGDFTAYNSRTQVGIGRSGSVPRCDTISVTGSAGFFDTLDVEPDPGFQSVAGETYVIATWGSRSGTFAPVLLRGSASAMADSFDVVYEANRLLLTAKQGTLGVGGGPGTVSGMHLRALGSPGRALQLALDLPAAATAHVTLLDVSGRTVARLRDGLLAAGEHRLTITPHDLPAGVYLARAVVEGSGRVEQRTVKVVLIR